METNKTELTKEMEALQEQSQNDFISIIHEIVSLYHEKWNRKGYEMTLQETILFNEIKNMINSID